MEIVGGVFPMKQVRRLMAGFVACLQLGAALTGCTTQAWYEGTQENQRQHCRETCKSADDQQTCIDAVNSHRYEQYRQERNQQ